MIDDVPIPDAMGLDSFVRCAADNWRECSLRGSLVKLLAYTEEVTRSPSARTNAEIAILRDAGWSDVAIHDAVQIVAYFNYINRIADALGVELEEGEHCS